MYSDIMMISYQLQSPIEQWIEELKYMLSYRSIHYIAHHQESHS